ncbi:MAG: UvrD-helicase domain-containing protein, partial [Spirochaetales bacterium]|nr:UvrD-helicase domain-containing protein [Spirochaetales bacterium]
RAKDKHFWSVRAGRDLRIIVHRTESTLVLCYVDHHDDAYAWAERRRLETHPKTGAAQLVEIREKIQEIVVPQYVDRLGAIDADTPLCAAFSDEELLLWGIPTDWLAEVREADEERLLYIAERLPEEAAQALLEIATGGTPHPTTVEETTPFDHPEAQRRFRIVTGIEELERALDYPWERWTVFLHPDQRSIVEKEWDGPASVTGSAGTGKTIVALHRAVFLARRDEEARVLLTTFSEALASALRERMRRLVYNEPRIAERIDVVALDTIAERLWRAERHTKSIATVEDTRTALDNAYATLENPPFTFSLVLSEWRHVVDLHNVTTWEEYRDLARLGRKTRLPERRRALLWSVFEQVRTTLTAAGTVTYAEMLHALAAQYDEGRPRPFTHVVADEAQDIGPAQLHFLVGLAGTGPNKLFFAGDTGQRIFRQPFSWASCGVEVQGRSRLLRVNYRTSHQIRHHADRLLDPEIVDADGYRDRRDDTVSIFNGPLPEIHTYESEDDETVAIAKWITTQLETGVAPGEIGVIVRSTEEIPRAIRAVDTTGIGYSIVDQRSHTDPETVSILTMHLAKGLEFRTVVVVACDDEVIPSQSRIEAVGDEADLEEVYATDRHLLYVACTRARDTLIVTGVKSASEFLDDLSDRRIS